MMTIKHGIWKKSCTMNISEAGACSPRGDKASPTNLPGSGTGGGTMGIGVHASHPLLWSILSQIWDYRWRVQGLSQSLLDLVLCRGRGVCSGC